jgi:penicillin-binding protein 1A
MSSPPVAPAPSPASLPSAPKRRIAGCFASLIASSGAILGVAVAVGVLGLVLALGAYQYWIVWYPGAAFEPGALEQRIVEDSPVYYRGGEQQVGVFFDEEHRQVLAWDEVPKPFIVALIAAEDAGYWSHGGVSPKHIVRAMIGNVTAGSVTSGGSTLTQQTAKNLFYRPDRSLSSKASELVNALRLEAHYSKQEILGLYLNQFHVTGNGRGLGIAARHFFDKPASELSVLECAYLAGLVKGPANYDPFASSDPERQQRARDRADERVRYVLGRILDEADDTLAGPMQVEMVRKTKAEAKRLLANGFQIPFKRGEFRYDVSVLIDEIGRRLGEAPFPTVFEQAGIADPSAAGLQVITTLDPTLQREAIYGLWHHLTEVGTQLEAINADGYRVAAPSSGSAPLSAHTFHTAVVASQASSSGKRSIEVKIGDRPCTVDRAAVVRVADLIAQGQKRDKGAKATSAAADALVAALQVGTSVWVSVRSVATAGAVCDLEVRPRLQGAVVAVQEGRVRAIVGGNDNRNFNRAYALRQLGSTWKPLVYHAALQLGWSTTDALDNRRNLFHFSTVDYWPTSDHTPAPRVGLAWAGVNSENLASVWLFYHLTDRLDQRATEGLATSLGLTRQAGESAADWKARLGKAGVNPKNRVDEARYLRARAAVVAGLGDRPDEADALRTLGYGTGFEAERRRVLAEGGADRDERLDALDRSYLSVHDRVTACEAASRRLIASANGNVRDAMHEAEIWARRQGATVDFACSRRQPDGYARLTRADIAAFGEAFGADPPASSPGAAPDRPRRPGWWPFGGGPANGRPKPERPRRPAPAGEPSVDLFVDGVARLSTLRRLDAQLAATLPADPWSPEILYWTQDFRLLLGMRYVQDLAQRLGVQSEIPDSLTVPLGAAEITLEEAAMMYDGVTSGLSFDFPATSDAGARWAEPEASTLLIDEVRVAGGETLYKAAPRRRWVTDAQTGQLTADILQNVVRHGTGRRADGKVTDRGGAVPIGGKTGTTNEYRNAAFVGFVPRADGGRYVRAGGVTIGVYVGYDDNTPMDVGNIKLAGASGALPAWIVAAQGVIDAGLVGHPTGKGPWTLDVDDMLARVAVDAETGLGGAGASVLARQTRRPPAVVDPTPTPRPARRSRGIDLRTPRPAPRGLWGR